MSSEPTVEECLNKLSKMFPKAWHHVYTKAYTIGNGIHREVEIVITERITGEPKRFYSQVLSEAMKQVHQWHKEHEPNG